MAEQMPIAVHKIHIIWLKYCQARPNHNVVHWTLCFTEIAFWKWNLFVQILRNTRLWLTICSCRPIVLLHEPSRPFQDVRNILKYWIKKQSNRSKIYISSFLHFQWIPQLKLNEIKVDCNTARYEFVYWCLSDWWMNGWTNLPDWLKLKALCSLYKWLTEHAYFL